MPFIVVLFFSTITIGMTPSKSDIFFKYNNGTGKYKSDFEGDYMCKEHGCSPLYCPPCNLSDCCLEMFNPSTNDKVYGGRYGCRGWHYLWKYKDLFWHKRRMAQKERKEALQEKLRNFKAEEKENKQLFKLLKSFGITTVQSLNGMLAGESVTTSNIIEASGAPKKQWSVKPLISDDKPLSLLRLFPWFKKHLKDMHKNGLPAVLAFVRDYVCESSFTLYEASKIINFWLDNDEKKRLHKVKCINPRIDGLGNKRVRSAFFYLIYLGKDESNKSKNNSNSIAPGDKKIDEENYDPFKFSIDLNALNLLNKNYENNKIIIKKNMELSYLGNLKDLFKFYNNEGSGDKKKGKLINSFALGLSVDPYFAELLKLGNLYESSSKKVQNAIRCYERLQNYNPKTTHEKKIQIEPWKNIVTYYKNKLKFCGNKELEAQYLDKAIQSCQLVIDSDVAEETMATLATNKKGKLQELQVKLKMEALVDIMANVIKKNTD